MKKFVKPALAVMLALSMCLSSVSVYAVNSKSTYFSDVNEDSFGWAAPYVDIIASKGIATGVGNNKFAPESLIKRGDFAIFLDKTFKFNQYPDTLFNMYDVTSDKYYYQSIVNGKLSKAITDVNYFFPENYITRLDAAKMIYNALSEGNLIGAKGSTDLSKYADKDKIGSGMDTIAIGTLTNMNFITGSSDGCFHPNDNLTRAEMAVIFAKVSEYVDNTKVEIQMAKEDAAKKAEEDAKAKTEEVKEDENTHKIISSGNINESVNVDTGKKVNMRNVTMSIPDQNSDAITVSNGTNLSLSDSTIKTDKNAAINIKDKSSASFENVSVKSNSASAIVADEGTSIDAENLVVDADGIAAISTIGGKFVLENSKLNLTNEGSVIVAGAGSEFDIKNSEITSDLKKTNLLSIINKDEYKESPVKMILTDSTLTNKKGYLFNFRDSVADILIENCKVDVERFVNNEYDKKDKQAEGCDATIAIKDSEVRGDILVDHETKLTLDIQSGGFYKGFIDQSMYSQDINIKIADDGRIELCSDIYVKEFITNDFNFNNVIDNGFSIYYDDTAEGNDYLYSDTYDLANGGQLCPR